MCVKTAADMRHRENVFAVADNDAAKSVEYSQLRTKNAGYRPYYMYRQKNTVGNLENVGYSLEGSEGMYNIFMMGELHSIFGVGAGAVTKIVSAPDAKTGKRTIERIFMPKYPYEYLRDADRLREGDAETPSFRERVSRFIEKNQM